MTGAPPALSVVIPTSSGWEPVARTIGCLADQTVADRIELIVVSFEGEPADAPPPAVAALHSHRVIAPPGIRSVADAAAAGARVAAASVVAFGEDHSFPTPGWAEALLDRHAEPWAVVGPVVRNGNPRTIVSWADYVLGYGMYAEGHPGGEVAMAPGHNSSYKRAVLERHDEGLEQGLEAEWVFHSRLRAEGERICLEPRAIVRHTNFGMLRPFVTVTARHGRVSAAARAARWSLIRRVAYAAASPVTPVVRLRRILRALPPAQRARMPRRAVLLLAAGLCADAVGQAAGFARPASGDERAALARLELDRLRFIPPEDIAALP